MRLQSDEAYVSIEELSAGYTKPDVILGASLRVGKGEGALIAGPSGSGKTTLFLAMTGVLSHLLEGKVEGKASIGGLDPLKLEDYELLPSKIGIVLQDPEKQIAMPTPIDELTFILENFGYSREEAEKRAAEALKSVGLQSKANFHVENLSGGEKRRLTIAASTVHDPPILLMDEPTASIDPWGIAEIRGLIRSSLDKGMAVLLIEHKPVFFKDLFERIYILRGGKLDKFEEKDEMSIRDVDFSVKECGEEKGKDIGSGKRVIEARDLAVGYGRAILRAEELEMREGEIVAIVGPNGSGKTTILKTIAGFIGPIEGEIVGERRRFYVPQFPDMLFIKRTVEEELRDQKMDLRARGSLKDLFPWYSSLKSSNPFRLSHGQRRWLSILIALGYDPSVLLLDEPSSGLDLILYNKLVDLLKRVKNSGKSVMISTHDPRLIGDLADRVYYIQDGKMAEKGKSEACSELYEVAGVVR